MTNWRKETELCKTNITKGRWNIAKQTLQQEIATGLNGLAHECNNICNETKIQNYKQ